MEKGYIYAPYIIESNGTYIIDGFINRERLRKLYEIYGIGKKLPNYSKPISSRYKKISI